MDEQCIAITIPVAGLDAALAKIRNHGLTVRLHSRKNNAWHIADGGLYSGYVVTAAELLELLREDKLTIEGIKELDQANVAGPICSEDPLTTGCSTLLSAPRFPRGHH